MRKLHGNVFDAAFESKGAPGACSCRGGALCRGDLVCMQGLLYLVGGGWWVVGGGLDLVWRW